MMAQEKRKRKNQRSRLVRRKKDFGREENEWGNKESGLVGNCRLLKCRGRKEDETSNWGED